MRPEESVRISQGARPAGDVDAIVDDAVVRWLDGCRDQTFSGRERTAGRRCIGSRQFEKDCTVTVRARSGEAGDRSATARGAGERTDLGERIGALTRRPDNLTVNLSAYVYAHIGLCGDVDACRQQRGDGEG